jgi:hypothetical protein
LLSASEGDWAGAGLSLVALAFDGADVVKGAKALSRLSKAGDYGLQSYNDLRKLLKGTGLEAHHLIEKRFADVLGVKQGDMLSVVVSKMEHQGFTNAWRGLIPYTGKGYGHLSKGAVEDAARQVYRDYPDILKALGLEP